MKKEDIRLGMLVKANNCFGTKYIVTKINKTTCWVEHRTGDKIMKGGRWLDEVFQYKNVKHSILKPSE
jgi:hypothetical protein